MLRSILPKFEFIPPDHYAYQGARLRCVDNSVCPPLVSLLGIAVAVIALNTSGIMRPGISAPILGILKTAILLRAHRPRLKQQDMSPHDQKIILAACLGVSLLPPLTAMFVNAVFSFLLWFIGYWGLYLWLLWFMGGRKPIRSEVESDLAYGQAVVTRAKEALERIEKDRPKTDEEQAKSAELEKAKQERDERLAVLEEAMRSADEPLDPVTASAQFQQIQTEYREAVEGLS